MGTFSACDWCHTLPDYCVFTNMFKVNSRRKACTCCFFCVYVYPQLVGLVREKYIKSTPYEAQLQRERPGHYVKNTKQGICMLCFTTGCKLKVSGTLRPDGWVLFSHYPCTDDLFICGGYNYSPHSYLFVKASPAGLVRPNSVLSENQVTD